ncbi:hypothetical protein [Paracoccus actinidiae]|uniref:hypothetical protein n=1 Tax=Paracoccus actinidiae TaxID=3064531 RepID=UPI0027D2F721|nr:hypothetical protein [Paracoccus sp. M09]
MAQNTSGSMSDDDAAATDKAYSGLEAEARNLVEQAAMKGNAAQGFERLVRPMAMTLDAPEVVAAHAWRAITARKREQLPPTRERLFVALQRLRPALIDWALIRLARDPAVIAAANDLSSRP